MYINYNNDHSHYIYYKYIYNSALFVVTVNCCNSRVTYCLAINFRTFIYFIHWHVM